MAYRTKQEELAIITQTYDLILWSCNHTGKFPGTISFVATSYKQFIGCWRIFVPLEGR